MNATTMAFSHGHTPMMSGIKTDALQKTNSKQQLNTRTERGNSKATPNQKNTKRIQKQPSIAYINNLKLAQKIVGNSN